MSTYPNLGLGLGLRAPHVREILSTGTRAQWFEALTENYLGSLDHGLGFPYSYLEKIRKEYPLVLHGTCLSIGGTDPIDLNYLGPS